MLNSWNHAFSLESLGVSLRSSWRTGGIHNAFLKDLDAKSLHCAITFWSLFFRCTICSILINCLDWRFGIQSHIGVMFSICQQNVAWATEIAGNQIQECWAICNMQVPRNGSISNSLRDTFWGKLKPCILSKHARSHLKRYYSTARHYSTLSRSRSCV